MCSALSCEKALLSWLTNFDSTLPDMLHIIILVSWLILVAKSETKAKKKKSGKQRILCFWNFFCPKLFYKFFKLLVNAYSCCTLLRFPYRPWSTWIQEKKRNEEIILSMDMFALCNCNCSFWFVFFFYFLFRILSPQFFVAFLWLTLLNLYTTRYYFLQQYYLNVYKG